ncbi:MAG: glycine cleavage system protein H [Bdellovibrionales bacterium]|nr:glycine cleavage system protein H [Bdellovibrionales bacterium]
MQEYDEGRIWFKQKGKVVTVGLTEKALEEIGSVQTVSLPIEGDECSQDDAVGEVEGAKATFEIIAPMDGTITSINDSLNEDTEILANDCLDEGWIYKIRVESAAEGDDGSEE